jgi:hypothetical protein
MVSKGTGADPLVRTGAIPLRGPHGLIGFIPMGAIDPKTDRIAFEVFITFADVGPISVFLHIDRNVFAYQARVADPAHAVEDLRQWLGEHAHQQLAAEQPEMRDRLLVQSVVYWSYWVNGRPAGHEPFFR